MNKKILLSLIVVPLLTACASVDDYFVGKGRYAPVSSQRGTTSYQQVPVLWATVQSVRVVQVRKPTSGFGAVIGATLGAVLGYEVTDHHGAGAAIGAATGGYMGHLTERGINTDCMYEIQVQLYDGRMLNILQEPEHGRFLPGQRVRVTWNASEMRVLP